MFADELTSLFRVAGQVESLLERTHAWAAVSGRARASRGVVSQALPAAVRRAIQGASGRTYVARHERTMADMEVDGRWTVSAWAERFGEAENPGHDRAVGVRGTRVCDRPPPAGYLRSPRIFSQVPQLEKGHL